jgi:phytanoyl-CoA dioxygenase PhyH
MTFALTSQQLDEFARSGLLRLEGLLPLDGVARARDAVLSRLARAGLWKDGAWRLDALPRPQWPDTGVKTAKIIGNTLPEVAALLDAPALCRAIDTLLDGRPFDRSVYKRPQMLFTLPNADRWTLPQGWHVDTPRLASGVRPGVQLFACLDTVAPEGGGTVAVAGSHRLLSERRSLRPSRVTELLDREPFFHRLFSGVGDDDARLPRGKVGNIALEVVELTGEPGDVWLMDLRTHHCGAPNASARPRMMMTYRYLRADLMQEVTDAYGWR